MGCCCSRHVAGAAAAGAAAAAAGGGGGGGGGPPAAEEAAYEPSKPIDIVQRPPRDSPPWTLSYVSTTPNPNVHMHPVLRQRRLKKAMMYHESLLA